MIEKQATIKNAYGIHCRPSAIILEEVAKIDGCVKIVTETGESDLTSIIALLALGLKEGDDVMINVTGDQEVTDVETMVELFERDFDFKR